MTPREHKYIIDSNALINLKGKANIESIWPEVVRLIENDRLKTVAEVICELKNWPGVFALIRPHQSKLKIGSNTEYAPGVTGWFKGIELLSPGLIDYAAVGDCEPADPWLIAVALEYGYTVVTNEKRKGSGCHNRIPYALEQLGGRSLDLRSFLSEVGIE